MKLKRKRVLLPLLNILKSLPAPKRSVLISYLNHDTLDGLYELIIDLNRSSKIPFHIRYKLAKKLRSSCDDFDCMIRGAEKKPHKKPSPKVQMRRLIHLGGSPMADMYKVAVPYLLNVFKN